MTSGGKRAVYPAYRGVMRRLRAKLRGFGVVVRKNHRVRVEFDHNLAVPLPIKSVNHAAVPG